MQQRWQTFAKNEYVKVESDRRTTTTLSRICIREFRTMSSLSRPGADEEVHNGVAVTAAASIASSSSSSSPTRVSTSSLLNSVQQQPKKQHPPPMFQNRSRFHHLVVGGDGYQQLDRYCAFCKVKDTTTRTGCNNNFITTCQVCNIFCYCCEDCQQSHSKTHSRDCDLISRFNAKELHVKVAALIIQQSTRGQFNIHQSYKRQDNATEEQQQQESTSSTRNSWKTRVTYLYERVVDEYIECYESIKNIGMSAEVGIQLHNDFYLVKPRIPLLLASLGYDDDAITELALMMDETGRCQRTKLRKNTDNIIQNLQEERRNFHPESWMACFLLTLLLVKLRLVSNYKLSYDGWSEFVNAMAKTVIPTAADAAGVGKGRGESGDGGQPDSTPNSDDDDTTAIILLPEDVQDLIKSYLAIPVLTDMSNQEQQLKQISTLLSRDDYLFDDDEQEEEEIDNNDDDYDDENDKEAEEEGSQHSNNIILKSLLLSPSDGDCENNNVTTNPVIRYYLEDEDSQYNENGLFRFIHDAFQSIPYRTKTIQDLKLL